MIKSLPNMPEGGDVLQAHERSHRLRVIRAQQTRGWVMLVEAAFGGKNPVC